MKRSAFILLGALLALNYACRDSRNAKTSAGSGGNEQKEVSDRQCYRAVDGKDTAWLNIGTTSSGKVVGDMVIRYANNPQNDGILEGEFKGDTLFADYTFTTGNNKEKKGRNPLAFLKEGKRLTLGVGIIETYLGRSYLAKDKPIRFDRGRFKFDPAECK